MRRKFISSILIVWVLFIMPMTAFAHGFDAEVYTKSLSINDKDGGILAELSYEMTLGGVSRVCEMVIELS